MILSFIVNPLQQIETELRIAVSGSRGWEDYGRFKEAMADLVADVQRFVLTLPGNVTLVLIDGDCGSGADALNKRYCREQGIERRAYPARWGDINALGAVVKMLADGSFFNANAGFARNKEMLADAHALIAFWDGTSKGTGHAISTARAMGIPTVVKRIDADG